MGRVSHDLTVMPVFLLARRDNRHHRVGQRPLQRARLASRRAQPGVIFFSGGEQDRHRLRVQRADDAVRLRGEEAVELVRAVDRVGLDAADTAPRRPDPGEGEQRPAGAERKPRRRLLRLRVGPSAERR